jgi:thiamine-monophosphate kinase
VTTRRLRDVGEHRWIAGVLRRLAARSSRVLLGPGDDAAVLRASRRPLVLTVDTLVEGVHFRAGWASARDLGRQAFRVNLSDLAAMGATPVAALLALEAPGDTPVATVDGVAAGVATDARRLGAALVGGNLTSGRTLAITVTLVGDAGPRVVRRSGARPGDRVFVTGRLGAHAAAVRALLAGRRERWPLPPVRVDAGGRLAGVASAMIDVSDGLLQDLGHVCRASGVAAVVDAASIPVAATCRRVFGADAVAHAATGGEDYELLVAVPPRRLRALDELRARLGCGLTEIGRIVPSSSAAGRPAVQVPGAAWARRAGGFDHFR